MALQVTPQVMLYKMYKLMRDEQGGMEPSQEFQDILQKLPKDMVSLSKYISLLRSNVPLKNCNKFCYLARTGTLYVTIHHKR